MAITQMEKVAILFPRAERDTLLSLLQEIGAFEIRDLKETPIGKEVEIVEAASLDVDSLLNEIKGALDGLSEFEERSGILSGLIPARVAITKDEFERTAKEFDLQKVIKAVNDIQARRNELRTRLGHLQAFIERLMPWQALNVPIESLKPTEHIGLTVGILTGHTVDAFQRELAEVSQTCVVQAVNIVESRSYLLIFYHKEDEIAVEEVFRRFELEIERFDNMRGMPSELIAAACREAEEIKARIEEVAQEGATLLQYKPKLMVVYDYYLQESNKAHAQTLIGATEKVGIIQGWVRRKDFNKLAQWIGENADSAEVLRIVPEPGESPPIELRNRRIVKPFEVITELYGMPHAREVDPTPLVAPFFALFFGFCITDAGYGIVLMALSLILMRYFKAGHKLLWLIFIGGTVTIFMGAITGGWFGLTEETIPPWLGFIATLRRKFMRFDPLENPMLMFGMALALGFIQVTFGLIVELIENLRQKDILAAIFDRLTWIVLLWSAVLFAATKTGRLDPSHASIFKWSAIAAAIGIIGFSHRVGKNPLVRLGWGFYHLYGITGYLGDILSYARLLALGLATGGIAMVINAVAVMAKGIPIVGYPAMVLVLAGGHTLNIAVNALGGFVHSARLQYVEFYPKFFEGGGKRFKPFAKELKYTYLLDKSK
ncbi:MAG: V-type ATP synthase subunit I [bacterium]